MSCHRRIIASLAAMFCLSGMAAENLLQNGSFENFEKNQFPFWGGTPGAFKQESGKLVTDGKSALRLIGKKADDAPIILQSVINFKKDYHYQLAYDAIGSRFGMEYRVYVGVWKGKEWVTGFDSNWRKANVSWQNVKTDFELKGDCDKLQVVIQLRGEGEMVFDHLRLEEISPLLERQAQVLEPELPAYSGQSSGTVITPDLQFAVAGKPFFSIGVWGYPIAGREQMELARSYGFNTVRSYLADELGGAAMVRFLDVAKENNLMVIPTIRFQFPDKDGQEADFNAMAGRVKAVVAAIKDHPALFAYDVADEPVWAGNHPGLFARGNHLLRELDPNHPLTVCHAPRNKIAELALFNRYVDVVGVDIYPVWHGGQTHSDIANPGLSVVGDETRKNIEACGGKKPVITTVQGNSWSDMGVAGEPRPTTAQYRFQAWNALASGATAVHFFVQGAPLYPELRPAVLELSRLQKVMGEGKIIVDPAFGGNSNLQSVIRKIGNVTFVVLVNPQNSPQKAILPPGKNWLDPFTKQSIGKEVTLSPYQVIFLADSADCRKYLVPDPAPYRPRESRVETQNPPLPESFGKELVLDGQFDRTRNGSVEAWNGKLFALEQVKGNQENHLLSLTVYPGENATAVQDIRQFVPEAPCRLSYQVLAPAGVEYRVYVGVWQDGRWITGVNTDFRKGSNSWDSGSVSFTPDKSANRLMVVLEGKNSSSVAAQILFDAISLQQQQ